MDAINNRGWPKLEVAPMKPEEVEKLTLDYLAQYRKTPDKKHLDRIVASPQTTNPLYLRALLEELRIFGIYEELDKKIDYYLGAKTIPDLYDRILARLEKDYEESTRISSETRCHSSGSHAGACMKVNFSNFLESRNIPFLDPSGHRSF